MGLFVLLGWLFGGGVGFCLFLFGIFFGGELFFPLGCGKRVSRWIHGGVEARKLTVSHFLAVNHPICLDILLLLFDS